MTKPRIYVETTIPSAYHTSRPGAEMAEKRELTRRWWAEAEHTCQLLTSVVVLDELRDGTSPHVPARLALLGGLDLLDVSPAVRQTASVYVRQKLMPGNPPDDALHLALASHHNCDVLVTWNFRHLANLNKLRHIGVINAQLGLPVPLITTPRRLLGGNDERS